VYDQFKYLKVCIYIPDALSGHSFYTLSVNLVD